MNEHFSRVAAAAPKRELQAELLTPQTLNEQNQHFEGTGGISQENRCAGFLPAFLDARTGVVHLSRFADGRVAPIHMLEGLPHQLIAARTADGKATAAISSVIAGFALGWKFYTREQAAKATAKTS